MQLVKRDGAEPANGAELRQEITKPRDRFFSFDVDCKERSHDPRRTIPKTIILP